MEVYRFEVQNLRFKGAEKKIVDELKKLHAVKAVDVNAETSEVKVIMDELGSSLACETALNSMGYKVKQPVF